MLTHVRHQFELIALAQHLRETKPDEDVYQSRLTDSVIRVAGLTALRTVIDFFNGDPGKFKTNMTAGDYDVRMGPQLSSDRSSFEEPRGHSRQDQRAGIAYGRAASPDEGPDGLGEDDSRERGQVAECVHRTAGSEWRRFHSSFSHSSA